jgi:hypothetical protein
MLTRKILLTKEPTIQRGKIAGFEEDGKILVYTDERDCLLSCNFVRSAERAPLRLNIDDPVLYVLDSSQEEGYILGLIERYTSQLDIPNNDSSAEKIEVELPGKLRNLRVNGKKICFEADDEIQLKCGKGMILITKQGKVVVRGTQLVSHSSGTNKIKGAAVRIN